ncbi:hypothetical protein CU098_002795 [Rhizopus stolonifer]|uniref:Trafficking protein particle complex subunit 11 n=1 Tax=Rhizopus stolonifer TaxID=4846 RepID=A0A367KG34_RHIST|nr:hypothetical protein CU098_002795 [Rhizopus stolonifer]
MYPPEYLVHPVPVLAVYGLTDDAVVAGDTSKLSLVSTLVSVLTNKTEYTLYEASRYLTYPQTSPPFRVMTVSKEYTLPQKQTSLPNVPPPHSPLSPLSTDSPLYPDGIMTPLWIKKHTYLPSVVVGCYELYVDSRSLRETGPLASQVLIDPLEREHDAQLATEINTRRKYFQDKGIKFAAVIMLKQRSLDPSVEERLSSIRKQCGLDAKSSFFTVTPGTLTEIQEFVNMLYRALYEPALQFYNNRLKKIRKKKSKLPSPTLPRLDVSSSEPLSVPGWMLRYELKIAFFQETRQDMEGALKSYEVAYSMLSDMLAPTMGHTGLTIHGKRWKEARQLIDCINIKLCRLQLYMHEPTAALSQLNGHLHMFQSHSSIWGMGEHTFEYWAWLSKQYRIFADVIDTAVHAGYKIPLPTAYLSASATPTSPLNHGQSGCNPGAILQHPGFYYHLAAMCCAERRRRYLEKERADPTNAALQTEKAVDHSSLTIELLTKSYEQFKRYRNSRMTLYLAAEIAGTYYETGKFEMAIKFFERIGKTYRKEKWHMVLTSILRWSLRCAKELSSWSRAIECLVELMSDDLPMAENKRNDIQKELMDMLGSDKTQEYTHLVIQMDQINAFVACQVQIKQQTNFVGTPIEYQVVLKTDKTSPPAPFRFQAVRVVFNDPEYNLIIQDMGIEEGLPKSVELNDVTKTTKMTEEGEYKGWSTTKADLRVYQGQIKAFQGSLIPQACGELKIVHICLDMISPQWHIELDYPLDKLNEEQPSYRRKWLEGLSNEKPSYKILTGRGCLSTVMVMQKPPSIDLKFEHAAPALLDELFKLNVTITSSEEEPIQAILIADIKNSEGPVAQDYVTFTMQDSEERETTIGLIEPHTSVSKTVYLHGSQVTGARLIHMTVKYTMAGRENNSQMVEKSESLRIPFIAPFDANFELCAQNNMPQEAISPNMSSTERWLLVASIRCFSTWDLDIKQSFSDPYTSLELISRMEDFDNQTWKTGHVYNANYLFQSSTLDITEQSFSIPTGKIMIEWKRSEDQQSNYYKTWVQLPNLPVQQHNLTVMADIPSEIYLGEPFTLTYMIHNPTLQLADYTASMELSEAFVFSGYKQCKGRVLPLSKTSYHYTCYPLLAGKVKIPRLKVMASQQQMGEREIPVQIAGTGVSFSFDNELEQKQTELCLDMPLLTFVNAKRRFV